MRVGQKKRIQWDKWADKKEKKERKERGTEKKEERSREREREKKRKKVVFRFSLRSTEIGLSVFVEPRGKVHLRNESYAWVPKSVGFVELQEVGNFRTWIISSLKVI